MKVYDKSSLFNLCPEIKPLLYGAGWQDVDMTKPWVLIESAAGEMHPGHIHLNNFEESIKRGIHEAKGKGAIFRCTDICDGIIQGSHAMRLSLASREIISFMVEIHAMCGHFDGIAYISACDKSIPAHIISSVRLNIPSILFPGGVMQPGYGNHTLEEVPSLLQENFSNIQEIYPSPGACAFLGTACTMQILAEVMGICLPHTALIPANLTISQRMAFSTGIAVMHLIEKEITPLDIINKNSIKNAITILQAIGGSTNAILHLIAISKEAGINIPLNEFDCSYINVPFILNIKPSGKYPSSVIWHAGGVPYLMYILKKFINLDTLTCTGSTWNENLKNLGNNFFDSTKRRMESMNIHHNDIITSPENSPMPSGGITIIHGNIAPEGGIIKTSALSNRKKIITGKAVVFDSYETAIQYAKNKKVNPEDAIVIRYEGPRGGGMPELYYLTDAIANNRKLSDTCILITDGRFSGASKGYCIGYISPEAAEKGPIALIENGDLIRLDLPKKKLDIVGIKGKLLPPQKILKVMEKRRKEYHYTPKTAKTGVERLYRKYATSASLGAGLLQ